MKDISLIIPHRNCPDLLQRCLDSIPVQDNVEVIIVDDWSDPQIVNINNFPGKERPDVRVVLSEKSGGAGAARNIGIKESCGRWLLFADADDVFAPDAFCILNSHVDDDDTDFIFFNVRSIYAESGAVAKTFATAYSKYICQYDKKPKERIINILKYNHDAPWGKMIKKQLVDCHGIRFDEQPVCNDTMFSKRVSVHAHKVTVDSRVVYDYLQNGNNSLIKLNTEASWYTRYSTFLRSIRYLRRNNAPYYVFLTKHYIVGLMLYIRQSWRFGIKCSLKALKMIFEDEEMS